jgi:hypothetical protein
MILTFGILVSGVFGIYTLLGIGSRAMSKLRGAS